MSANKVVINASPFILLSKTRILDSLNEIFDRVVMPEGVAAEIGRGNDIASDRLSVVKNEWLSVELATLESEVGIWNLGVGETEVLSYALNHPDHLAVVDDRAARRCAETLRIKCLGTAAFSAFQEAWIDRERRKRKCEARRGGPLSLGFDQNHNNI